MSATRVSVGSNLNTINQIKADLAQLNLAISALTTQRDLLQGRWKYVPNIFSVLGIIVFTGAFIVSLIPSNMKLDYLREQHHNPTTHIITKSKLRFLENLYQIKFFMYAIIFIIAGLVLKFNLKRDHYSYVNPMVRRSTDRILTREGINFSSEIKSLSSIISELEIHKRELEIHYNNTVQSIATNLDGTLIHELVTGRNKYRMVDGVEVVTHVNDPAGIDVVNMIQNYVLGETVSPTLLKLSLFSPQVTNVASPHADLLDRAINLTLGR